MPARWRDEVAIPAEAAVLEPLVRAGVFGPFEVQLAAAAGRLEPDTAGEVLVALALAARAPRFGHVCVDLSRFDDRTVGVDEPAEVRLAWPSFDTWARALPDSALVSGPDSASASPVRPLVWDGTRVYLQRYWHYEVSVAEDLVARMTDGADRIAAPAGGSPPSPDAILDLLFGEGGADPDLQRRAAERALGEPVSIIAGGPGTGKTHTVARILVATHVMANATGREPRVALAAPTGKAAARMKEAVGEEVGSLLRAGVIGPDVALTLDRTEAVTIHRLLGGRGPTHFRHGRGDPLPHDLVIIDETSMVSLPLMSKLLDAVSHDARLVLVGDPYQLASIEAGTVMGDLVGPAEDAGDQMREDGDRGRMGSRVTALRRMHRFSEASAIAAVAAAVRTGDADTALALLDGAGTDVVWIRPDDRAGVAAVCDVVADAGIEVVRAAMDGDSGVALEASSRIKVLAATRRGPLGLQEWSDRIESCVATAVPAMRRSHRWYAGRPILVTGNDSVNAVFNGDVGVVVDHQGVLSVDMAVGNGVRSMAPSRLDQVETWWAMTVHKSQGSEFHHAVVSLPEAGSPILTRELLYTAVTRARQQLTVVASEASLRDGIGRPLARASGLGERLWGL